MIEIYSFIVIQIYDNFEDDSLLIYVMTVVAYSIISCGLLTEYLSLLSCTANISDMTYSTQVKRSTVRLLTSCWLWKPESNIGLERLPRLILGTITPGSFNFGIRIIETT